MKASGLTVDWDKVVEFKFMQMDQSTKETGELIKPTAKDVLSLLMAMYTKANGLTTSLMALG